MLCVCFLLALHSWDFRTWERSGGQDGNWVDGLPQSVRAHTAALSLSPVPRAARTSSGWTLALNQASSRVRTQWTAARSWAGHRCKLTDFQINKAKEKYEKNMKELYKSRSQSVRRSIKQLSNRLFNE